MIWYKISYYNGDRCLGGQFLGAWQLKIVKILVNPYFKLFKLKEINVRMEKCYTPDMIKQNIEILPMEAI